VAQGADPANPEFAHPAPDAPDTPEGEAPPENNHQETRPASPAAELAQGLRAVASGAAVAAAAQAIGDQARAAALGQAPGQAKKTGETAASGRGATRSAERPAPAPPPTKDRVPRPADETDAAIAATAAQSVQDSNSERTDPPRRLVIEAHATSAFAPTAREAAATSGAAARFMAAHPPAVQQLTIHIQRAVRDGLDRISIRLSPPELGRIDVKLDFADDGRLSTSIAVERPETLELLQRDARGLERALNDAGVRTESGSLTFNLRGEGRQDAREDGQRPRLPDAANLAKADSVTIVEIAGTRPNAVGASGIDIRV
jgi:flagellar hook-length control protein FliK